MDIYIIHRKSIHTDNYEIYNADKFIKTRIKKSFSEIAGIFLYPSHSNDVIFNQSNPAI